MFINGAGHGSQAFLRAHPHRRLRPATIARIRRSLRHDSKLSLVQELPRRRPARNQSGPLSEHSGRPRRHRRALPRQGGVHQHGLRPDLQPHGCAHQGTRRLPPESRPQARRPRRHHDAEPSAVRHRHVRLPARGLHRRQHQPALHLPRGQRHAARLRGEGNHHHRELRQDTPERPARHEVRAHHHDRRRRPLPVLQAHARQLRRAQGEEDGARILAPERRRLQRSA